VVYQLSDTVRIYLSIYLWNSIIETHVKFRVF